MFEADMIGAIKIKDGLFIGDELASQVSIDLTSLNMNFLIKQSNDINKMEGYFHFQLIN